MNVTNNLKLPQYTEEDIFDLQDINKAYSNIDNAYKEVIDFKNEIPKTNATAEVINARGGKETLGERLDEFDSQLEHIATIPSGINIANEINTLVNNGVKCIKIPKGRYYVSEPIKLGTGVQLMGDKNACYKW